VRKSIPVLIVLCGLFLSGCAKSSSKQYNYTGPQLNDIDYAKKVFQLLADGDEAVKSMIDWEHLKMMNVDVGAMYTKTSGDDARDKNVTDFIKGYSTSFKKTGGSINNLSNWREQSRDATNTVVAADGQMGQHLFITVSHPNNQQKVSTFELK
jgi:PBP1b-binding outer membrane lipoprotein LpoB